MSAFDPKRTSLIALQMSAFGGKADIDYVDCCDARACKRFDTNTQGGYTKSKPAPENDRDFNGSERQTQILPLTIAFTQFGRPMIFLNLRNSMKEFRLDTCGCAMAMSRK
jgi:hypothetical protein